MRVVILSSTFGHLEDYVKPYLASVQTHEPGVEHYIVDNGSPEPIPGAIRTSNLAIMTSFNRAIDTLTDDWDWLILTDSDVICTGPFLHLVEQFEQDAIYGQQQFQEDETRWFDGWLYCVPRRVWELVGPFDEDFLVTGAFQDLDYCLRADKAGYQLKTCSLPFIHLEANTTHKSPAFWENREHNRKLILEKHGLILRRK